jgi:hypothetical protein
MTNDATEPTTRDGQGADAIVALPAGRLRRLSYAVAPLVHAYFATAAFAGAAGAARGEFLAAGVAVVLYGIAGATCVALFVIMVSLQVRVRRGGTILLQPVQALYVGAPIGGAFLLSAAYVARLNGGSFFGGFEAMVGTTLALVLLARRVSELRLGSAGPVSGPIRVPVRPVAEPVRVADQTVAGEPPLGR